MYRVMLSVLIVVIIGAVLYGIYGEKSHEEESITIGVVFVLCLGLLVTINVHPHNQVKSEQQRASMTAVHSKKKAQKEAKRVAETADSISESRRLVSVSESAVELSRSQSWAATQEVAQSPTVESSTTTTKSVSQSAPATSVADPRPEQPASQPTYDYQPVPVTPQEETVFVNSQIPMLFHKDANCRGLQRYGGGSAMTLSAAQQAGYVAFCAYERYG